ncbi:MAG TPA: DUF732 domain-containing protein [Mycobacterium sp.]|nr:DUF732 domain-containing protein [Mycobacterium sp.]
MSGRRNQTECCNVRKIGDDWMMPSCNLLATFAVEPTDVKQRIFCPTGVSGMTITRTRRPSRLVLLLAAGLVPALGLLGPLAGAPTSRADATDDAFVAALRAHGIEHESAQSAIAAGHLVCNQLGKGKTQEQVATDVMNSSGIDGDNAGYFVAVAERAYCPQYADIP